MRPRYLYMYAPADVGYELMNLKNTYKAKQKGHRKSIIYETEKTYNLKYYYWNEIILNSTVTAKLAAAMEKANVKCY